MNFDSLLNPPRARFARSAGGYRRPANFVAEFNKVKPRLKKKLCGKTVSFPQETEQQVLCPNMLMPKGLGFLRGVPQNRLARRA